MHSLKGRVLFCKPAPNLVNNEENVLRSNTFLPSAFVLLVRAAVDALSRMCISGMKVKSTARWSAGLLLLRTESQSVRLYYPFHPSEEISIPLDLSSGFGGGGGEAAHTRPVPSLPATQLTQCPRTVRCSWSVIL